jgi:putative spermidine/putrescine transport system substrate-binding protein
MGVMKHLSGLELDCFYEYLIWYMSGFPGAVVAREGYYSAQPLMTKKFLTDAEWDYWYGGKPAATDIMDPFGKLVEKAGHTRDGGSFDERMGHIAVWNSIMDEDRYLIRRWNEFITS